MKETIDLLRFALAEIWCLVEYNDSLDRIWEISEEALNLTIEYARPKCLNGPETWEEYKKKYSKDEIMKT